jgi:hypothetical protein
VKFLLAVETLAAPSEFWACEPSAPISNIAVVAASVTTTLRIDRLPKSAEWNGQSLRIFCYRSMAELTPFKIGNRHGGKPVFEIGFDLKPRKW